jgi:hypothetical protein
MKDKLIELAEKWHKKAEEKVGSGNSTLMSMGLNAGEINTLRKCAMELKALISNESDS